MKQLPAKGFTLIELLVSVALFATVMVVALGALLALSSGARKAEGINTAVNNISAAIDGMTRAMRTGSNYFCGSGGTGASTSLQDCASPTSQFTFLDATNVAQTYCLFDTTANACNAPSAITCTTGDLCTVARCTTTQGNTCSTFSPVTSSEITVQYLAFTVRNTARAPGDTAQPFINIYLGGSYPVSANQTAPFQLQTSVTQRIYDQ